MSVNHVFGEAKACDLPGILSELGHEWPSAARARSEINLRAVGLIVARGTENLESDPVVIGSCLLVGRDWVLTAHHVLLSQEFAQNFQAVFDFVGAPNSTVDERFLEAKKYDFSSDKSHFFKSNDGIFSGNGHDYMGGDWVLIKIKLKPDENHEIIPLIPRRVVSEDMLPQSRGFFVPYHQSGFSSVENKDIPFGLAPVHALITDRTSSIFKDTQRIAAYDPADWKIEHYAAAHSGASGAPLMSIDGKFVGIHLRSVKKASGINPGLACSARTIAEILKNEHIFQNDPSFTLKLSNFT